MTTNAHILHIVKSLNEINKKLSSIINNEAINDFSFLQAEKKEYLTASEAAALISSKISYIYRLTHEKRIPYSKPGGNRIMIKRSDLDEWLKSNHISSDDEIRKNTLSYFKKPSRN